MMKEILKKRSDLGQSLVLVTLLLFAFMALLALVLDGGYAYAQRRAAQNAADAGALAGARESCLGNGPAYAVSTALDFAEANNADPYPLTTAVDLKNHTIRVDTQITYNSFFAGLIGYPTMTVSATATAKCQPPSGVIGMLPVAWSCKPLLDEDPSGECTIKYGESNLYLIMDDNKLLDASTCKDTSDPDYDPLLCDIFCYDPITGTGAIDCDLYGNDGINDVFTGGDRSWLILEKPGGTLADWITNGYAGEIRPHTWYEGKPGANTSAFQAAELRIGDEVIVPIYNYVCPQGAETSICNALQCPESVTDINATCQNFPCFHVYKFSTFHITCVSFGKNNPDPQCEAKQKLLDKIGDKTLKIYKDIEGMATVEGYFVKGYVPGLIAGEGDCNEENYDTCVPVLID